MVWYLITTQLIIPWANDGRQPFYLEYFYGSYGGSIPEIAGNILRHPDRVVRDGIEPDRIQFYRDLLLPWGGLPLLAPLRAADGAAADAGQRDRGEPVRPHDQVPVHGGDDRPDRDRRDRGRPQGCGASRSCGGC